MPMGSPSPRRLTELLSIHSLLQHLRMSPDKLVQGTPSFSRCDSHFKLARVHCHRSCFTKGHTLSIGEGWKKAPHNTESQSVGVSFVSIVVRTLKGWSEEAIHTIGKIDRILGCTSPCRAHMPFVSIPVYIRLEGKCKHVAGPPCIIIWPRWMKTFNILSLPLFTSCLYLLIVY